MSAHHCTYCGADGITAQCDYCGAVAERIVAPVVVPKREHSAALRALAPQPNTASMMREVRQMSRDELKAFVTMPDGREYSYWRHGSGMKAQQRIVFGAATRQLHRMPAVK